MIIFLWTHNNVSGSILGYTSVTGTSSSGVDAGGSSTASSATTTGGARKKRSTVKRPDIPMIIPR